MGIFTKILEGFLLRYKDFTQTNLEMSAGMIEFRISYNSFLTK